MFRGHRLADHCAPYRTVRTNPVRIGDAAVTGYRVVTVPRFARILLVTGGWVVQHMV